jgi:hypothetical protein
MHKAEAQQTARFPHSRHSERQGDSGMQRPATGMAPVAYIAKHGLMALSNSSGHSSATPWPHMAVIGTRLQLCEDGRLPL